MARMSPRPALDRLPLYTTSTGISYRLLKVVSSGAQGLRIHFSEFHLPHGASLWAYTLPQNGQAAKVLGPYTTAGPMGIGEFWLQALPGEEVVLEWQAVPASHTQWPFLIENLGHLETIPRNPSREITETPRNAQGVAIASKLYWPGGVIPYVIDAALPSPARVTDAVDHWNSKLTGHVTLIPRTTEKNYLLFRPTDQFTCTSNVGFDATPAQPVYLHAACATRDVRHEVGHAIGLFHEHQRRDRDYWVRLYPENMQLPAANSQMIQTFQNAFEPTGYDYASIMHYNRYAYSINGQPTMDAINPPGATFGNSSEVSAGDVTTVKAMYPFRGATPTNIPPYLDWVTPGDGGRYFEGSPIGFSVQAGDQDGTVAKVQYFEGTTFLGESTVGPNFSFSWNAIPVGNHTVTAKAIDNGGAASWSRPITIYIFNSLSPRSFPQSVTTAEDTALSIALAGSDPQGRPLSYTIVSGPTHGTLAGAGASQTYTPSRDYFGFDQFIYRVNNGLYDSQNSAIDITVTPVDDGTPSLQLSKTASPTTGGSGTLVTYSISYQNAGTGPATNVVIQDVVPAGTTLQTGSITAGGVYSGGTITWTLGTVAPGASGVVRFQVIVN